MSCEHTRDLETIPVYCDTEEMQSWQLYHVDDFVNFLDWLSSAWALEVMHWLFFCYNFAHSSISHDISHIFAYFTKNGSTSIQWYHDWSHFSVLTVPLGRCYARLSGLSVPPNTELELSLSFSLRNQQHTAHCTIHRGLMKHFISRSWQSASYFYFESFVVHVT